jgi:uncharacterized protein (TIGR03435 family)
MRTMATAVVVRLVARLSLLAMLGVLSTTLMAQEPGPASNPAFEVSVVRLSKPDENNSNLNLGQDRLQAKNLTLQSLVKFAYALNSGSDDQIIGGPEWMKSIRFDLEAKLDPETAVKVGKLPDNERIELLREMLRAVLADRFQLKVQRETRSLSAIRIQAIGQTKLVTFAQPAERSAESKSWQGLHNDGHGHIEGHGATMKMLASLLALQPEVGGRFVADQTGLPEQERFTFDLKWVPDNLGVTQSDEPAASGLSLFAAIQDQLGLRLTAGKVPVEVVVIDRAEMPSEN